MRSKKLLRLLSLILLVSILLSSTVMLQARAELPPGIDRSRIKSENNIGHKVVLESDQIKFNGSLTKQTPLSEEELKKLIEETMKELGIDSIEKLNEMVEKAKKWDEITQEDIDKFIEDLIKTIGTVPSADKVADILDVLNKIRTNDNADQALGDLLIGYLKDGIIKEREDYLQGELDRLAESGNDNSLLKHQLDSYNNLKNIGDKLSASLGYIEFMQLLLEKYGQDQQKWKDRLEGAQAKAMLNKFYEELQKKIDKAKNDKKDESYWLIDFNNAKDQRQNFSFFGVEGNNQTWELTMKLKQTQSTGDFSFDSDNVAGSAAGTYEGDYTIKTDSDLGAFAANPRESIMEIGIHGENMKYLENLALMLHPNNQYYAEATTPGSARNIRILKGSCTAYVLKSGEIQLSVGAGEEKIQNIFRNLNIAINEVTHDGLSGEFLYHEALDAEIKAIPDDKKVFVEYADTGRFVAGDPSYNWDAVKWNLEMGLEIKVMFEDLEGEGYYDWDDSEIWKPWDDSIKTMRITK